MTMLIALLPAPISRPITRSLPLRRGAVPVTCQRPHLDGEPLPDTDLSELAGILANRTAELIRDHVADGNQDPWCPFCIEAAAAL